MPVTTVDAVREAVEAFTHESALEHYLHFSGRKAALETAAIVERHAAAFTPEALRLVLDARDGTGGDAERRRLTALAQAVAESCMQRELAPLTDELATEQARASITVGGEEMGYYSAMVAVQNEPDRRRRAAIETARVGETARLNPLRERMLRRHHELIGELGFASYIDFYSALKGIDVRALGEVMSAFLERTRELYLEHVTPWFESTVGVPFAGAERHDAAVLFRMTDHDAAFAGDRMVEELRRTLMGMGVALDDQPNVHLDTEDRPGKYPRAFCAPVRTPDEVYLVIRPAGGYQDWRALFHEAGHTEHFAHVERTLPFEDRDLGDNSVTEAYAFTLEHLLLDRAWVEAHTAASGEALAGLLGRAHVFYLYMLRRYGAKLLYELALHGAGAAGGGAMSGRYSELLTHHLGFRFAPEMYLDDVDPGFYCAQYLRAWMLEAQLRERWRAEHGERWWERGGAGAEIRRLWSMGQALPAHLLAAELGMPGLDTGAMERRVRDALS